MCWERTMIHQGECAIPLGTATGGSQLQSVPGAPGYKGSFPEVLSRMGPWSLQPTS